MKHIKHYSKIQEDIQIQGKIDSFFDAFSIGKLLHQCGVRKRHGYGSRFLIEAIFTLPFVGMNLYRGIVINKECTVGKDAVYDILKGTTYNWRRLLLKLGVKLHSFFNRLTEEKRVSVLIIDDSTYDRSRSKKVELLSRVKDHTTGNFVRGFRMLTICWSDGVSSLPLDFALLSSAKKSNRYCESQKQLDKRCCAYRRRQEATMKSTELLEPMLQRILSSGIRARYLLMDSWFGMPAIIALLSKHIDVICMVKKTSKVHYGFEGQPLCVKTIYNRLRKRRGRAKILASTVVTIKGGQPVRLVFVRDRRKKDWLVLLSTDITLPESDIVQLYGKRWDIEVFFKMAKQHLKLVKEIQCRDFDALIAHTTIVFMRYMFVTYNCRRETDHRTFGDLFYACCDELRDISFIEALYRILTLAVHQLQVLETFCEKTIQMFFETLMEAALCSVGISRSQLGDT